MNQKNKIMAKITMSEKNKAFWKLPKEKQRVAIAKDVIKHLSVGFYKAKSGTYLMITKTQTDMGNTRNKQVDELLIGIKNTGGQCAVCGIGSCFASLAILGDDIAKPKDFDADMYDEIYDDSMRPKLRKVFDRQQLQFIEAAFERTDLHIDKEHTRLRDIDLVPAVRFGKRFRSDRGRLLAIMKNIIKNKGTFIPPPISNQ